MFTIHQAVEEKISTTNYHNSYFRALNNLTGTYNSGIIYLVYPRPDEFFPGSKKVKITLIMYSAGYCRASIPKRDMNEFLKIIEK